MNEPSTSNTDLSGLLKKYLKDRKVLGLSPATLKGTLKNLTPFLRWCDERGINSAKEVDRFAIENWQRHLATHKGNRGKPLSISSQRNLLKAVRQFFKWMTKKRILVYNPASDLELPKRPLRLPRDILSPQELESIFEQTKFKTPLGLRDRAIMETFYSTGIRRTEMTRLNLKDLDSETGSLRVRLGKGGKDRLVPIGDRALAWMEKYLNESRMSLLHSLDEKSLFISRKGKRLSPDYLGEMVGGYIKKAGLNKVGSCHLFRHSMATLMLKNGADIRILQEILGHSKITTTQIYTHLTIEHLKKVHTLTHPAKFPGQNFKKTDQNES